MSRKSERLFIYLLFFLSSSLSQSLLPLFNPQPPNPWPKINLQNHNTTTLASSSKQPQNPATQNAKHPNAIVVLNHHWPPHCHLYLCIFFRVFDSKKKKGGEERESKQRKRIKERERMRETEMRYLKYKIFIFYKI